MTIPIMTYGGKRHFSEQLFKKIIATMLQEGLNYLSILTIKNDIAKQLSYEEVTKEFEAKNVGKKSCSVYNCQVVSKKYIWLSF